jgi:hypothetical protein
LNLSDTQRDQLKQAMRAHWESARHNGAMPGKDWKDAKDHGAKVFEAFKQDHFVMDEVAPPKDRRAGTARMADGMINMAETALPILTPEQRTLAAQKLRDRAAHGEALTPQIAPQVI